MRMRYHESWDYRKWLFLSLLAALILYLVDVAVLETCHLLAYDSRMVLVDLLPETSPIHKVLVHDFRSISTVIAFFPTAYLLAGLYPGYDLAFTEKLRRQELVTLVLCLGLIACEGLFFSEYWSRSVLILLAAYALVAVPLAGIVVRKLLSWIGLMGIPTLIIGAGEKQALLASQLARTKDFYPIGFLDDDPAMQGRQIGGLPVLGTLAEVASWRQKGVQTAVVLMPEITQAELSLWLSQLPFPRIILVMDFLSHLQTVSHRYLAGLPVVEVRKPLLLKSNLFLKRVLDYLLGIPLFLVGLAPIAFFALWIKVVSPGPAFYAQERIGYQGRRFRLWKLRTMYPDAESRLETYLRNNPEAQLEWKSHFKLKNDPRIIPGIGHFLRRTSLDELPQFWNVLLGDMSLVGPRPLPGYHLNEFSPSFRRFRQSVLPGVTGLWQVSVRSEGDLQALEALDTRYICSWSLRLDLILLVKTAWVILTGKGAY